MQRFIIEKLLKWKENKDRKTLILIGARQVGKTYILKEFETQLIKKLKTTYIIGGISKSSCNLVRRKQRYRKYRNKKAKHFEFL